LTSDAMSPVAAASSWAPAPPRPGRRCVVAAQGDLGGLQRDGEDAAEAGKEEGELLLLPSSSETVESLEEEKDRGEESAEPGAGSARRRWMSFLLWPPMARRSEWLFSLWAAALTARRRWSGSESGWTCAGRNPKPKGRGVEVAAAGGGRRRA